MGSLYLFTFNGWVTGSVAHGRSDPLRAARVRRTDTSKEAVTDEPSRTDAVERAQRVEARRVGVTRPHIQRTLVHV